MRSIWNDLLFLHGHVADLKLARRLAEEHATQPTPERRPLRKHDADRVARVEAARIPPCGGGACSTG